MPKITQTQEFKDSPLGKIPEDWEVHPIEMKLQKIIDYRGRTPEKTNSGIPLITAKNVRDGYLDIEPREYIHEEDYDTWMRRGIPNPDDVLFTTEAPLGNVAKVPDYKIALAQRLLTLIANPSELDANYLFWVLQWVDSRRRLEQKSSGSTVLGIKQSVFRQVLFRFPPIEQQRRIAAILDTIDSTIALTSTLIAKLKQMKAGLLHDLLTRGLDENGKLRDAIEHPEQFKDSPLGQIPKDWEITTLGAVIARSGGFIQTGPFGSQLHAHEYTDSGVAVIMPKDILDGQIRREQIAYISSEKASILARHIVELNDVVFARRGDLERCAAIHKREAGWFCGTGCLLVRSPQGEIHAPWLAAIYQHDFSQRQILARAVGSTMVNLNSSLLAGLLIAKPPLSEQVTIMDFLNVYEARIRNEEIYLNKLKEQKKGLMHDLLTGRVRVTDLKEIPA